MPFACPTCHRPLHNRRRPACGFCGARIPESLRLSAQKRQFLDDLRSREEKRHREFMDYTGSMLASNLPNFPGL